MKLSLEKFLKHKNEFKLGGLTTESFHQDTVGLKKTCQTHLTVAIEKLRLVDIKAQKKYIELNKRLEELKKQIKKNKGTIYLVGCGATGRLVLHLEKVSKLKGKIIISFMAGGDAAVIKSIEAVEDYEDGEKHLKVFCKKRRPGYWRYRRR